MTAPEFKTRDRSCGVPLNLSATTDRPPDINLGGSLILKRGPEHAPCPLCSNTGHIHHGYDAAEGADVVESCGCGVGS